MIQRFGKVIRLIMLICLLLFNGIFLLEFFHWRRKYGNDYTGNYKNSHIDKVAVEFSKSDDLRRN